MADPTAGGEATRADIALNIRLAAIDGVGVLEDALQSAATGFQTALENAVTKAADAMRTAVSGIVQSLPYPDHGHAPPEESQQLPAPPPPPVLDTAGDLKAALSDAVKQFWKEKREINLCKQTMDEIRSIVGAIPAQAVAEAKQGPPGTGQEAAEAVEEAARKDQDRGGRSWALREAIGMFEDVFTALKRAFAGHPDMVAGIEGIEKSIVAHPKMMVFLKLWLPKIWQGVKNVVTKLLSYFSGAKDILKTAFAVAMAPVERMSHMIAISLLPAMNAIKEVIIAVADAIGPIVRSAAEWIARHPNVVKWGFVLGLIFKGISTIVGGILGLMVHSLLMYTAMTQANINLSAIVANTSIMAGTGKVAVGLWGVITATLGKIWGVIVGVGGWLGGVGKGIILALSPGGIVGGLLAGLVVVGAAILAGLTGWWLWQKYQNVKSEGKALEAERRGQVNESRRKLTLDYFARRAAARPEGMGRDHYMAVLEAARRSFPAAEMEKRTAQMDAIEKKWHQWRGKGTIFEPEKPIYPGTTAAPGAGYGSVPDTAEVRRRVKEKATYEKELAEFDRWTNLPKYRAWKAEEVGAYGGKLEMKTRRIPVVPTTPEGWIRDLVRESEREEEQMRPVVDGLFRLENVIKEGTAEINARQMHATDMEDVSSLMEKTRK